MKLKKSIKNLGISSLAVLASFYVLQKDVSAKEIDSISESKKPLVRSIDSFYNYIGDDKLEDFLSIRENRYFKVPKGYTNTHIVQDLFKKRLIKNPLIINEYKQTNSKGSLYTSLVEDLPIQDASFLIAGQEVDLLSYVNHLNQLGDPDYSKNETANLDSNADIPFKTKSSSLKDKNYKPKDLYDTPMGEKSKPEDSLPEKNPNNVAVTNEINIFRKEDLDELKDKNDEKDPKKPKTDTLEGLVLSGEKKNNESAKDYYDYIGNKSVDDYFSKEENRFFEVPKGYTSTHIVQDLFKGGFIKNPFLIYEYERTTSMGSFYSFLAKELPTKNSNVLYAGEKIDLLRCVEHLNELGNPDYGDEEDDPYSDSFQTNLIAEKKEKELSDSKILFSGDNDDNYSLPFTKQGENNTEKNLDGILEENNSSSVLSENKSFNVETNVKTLTDIETFSGRGESYDNQNILNDNLGAPFEIKESFELDLSPTENLLELYSNILNFNTEFVEHRLRYLSNKKKLNVNGELELLFGLTYLVSGDKEDFVDKLNDYDKEIKSKEGKRYIKSVVEVDLYNLAEETNRSIKFSEAIKYFNIVKNAAFLGGINPVSGALNLGFMLYDNFVDFEEFSEGEKTSLFFMQTHMRHFPDSVKFDELKPKFVDLIGKYCMESSNSYDKGIEELIDEGGLSYARFSLLSKNYAIQNITETYFSLDPEFFNYVRTESLNSSKILEVKIREKENELAEQNNFIISNNLDMQTDAKNLEEMAEILNGDKLSPKVENRVKEAYDLALKNYKNSRSIPNLITSRNTMTKSAFARNLLLGLAVSDFSNFGKALYRSTFLSATDAAINTTIRLGDFTPEEEKYLDKSFDYFMQEDLTQAEKNEMFLEKGKIFLRRNHLDRAYSSFSNMDGESYKTEKDRYLEKVEQKITSGLIDTCKFYLDEGQHLNARELYSLLEDKKIPFFDKHKMRGIKTKIDELYPLRDSEIQVRDIDY